jgi:hypothetical protein
MKIAILFACVLVAVVAAVDPADWVRVPGGATIHRSCVRRVESGTSIRIDEMEACKYIHPSMNDATADDQIYNMDVHWTPTSEVMKSMNATWNCPANPQSNDFQTLFYWPGFKSTSPTMGLPVLQPVLQYEDGAWGLASWFVYGNIGVAYESTVIDVSPGDSMNGWMLHDTHAKLWTINGYNYNTGQNTTLLIGDSDVYNTQFKVAMLVLETIMDQSNCADLPSDNKITFTGVSVNGHSVAWTDRIGDSSCHQSFVDKSTTVTFNWQS